jgi:hypothetical protein
MEIAGEILTIIVLGFAFAIWMLSLHLDEVITIIVDVVFLSRSGS